MPNIEGFIEDGEIKVEETVKGVSNGGTIQLFINDQPSPFFSIYDNQNNVLKKLFVTILYVHFYKF